MLAAVGGDEQAPGPGRVPTWRDGVFLSREEKARLTPEQLGQYLDDSLVRDLAEIETTPEPARSRLQQLVARARARVERRISDSEGQQAS
jgi:hypothetical protein